MVNDVDELLAFLQTGMRHPGSLTDLDTAHLLHSFTFSTLRDAALAALTGYPQDAAALAASRPPATSWFTHGPLDQDTIAAALPLLQHLASQATGTPAATPLAAVLAYLDWALGHPVRATQRLATADHRDPLVRLLRRALAAGVPAPRVTSQPSAKGSR
ncbi:hypothetical protein [uncultured Cellulomonas sp.]|uniref:hypothetical protein n=1 Tax=uncultured Cellulomonas sp. TaxID=189682 RepID=UPI002625DB96|nr:hypothetical protein [uncultured Cellulomonas sp.]